MSDFPSESDFFDEESFIRLKEENDALKKKNASFESQLQRTLELISQTDKITAENTKIRSELRNTKLNLSEIENRLNQSLKQNLELEDLLKKAKQHSETVINNEKELCNNEIFRISEDFQQKINSQKNEISALKQQINDLDISHKVYIARIDRFVQSAQRHFQIPNATIEEMTQIMNKPKQIAEPVVKICIDEENMIKAANAAKKYKNKAKNLLQKLQETENKLKEQQKMHEDEYSAFTRSILDLKSQIKEKEAEIFSQKENYERIKKQLEKKVENLKNMLEKSKQNQRVTFVPEKTEEKDEKLNIKNQKQKIENLEKENENLQSNISYLKAQNQQLVKEKEDTLSKLFNVSKERSELLIEKDQQNNEIKSLKTVHEEETKEIEALRKSLLDRQNVTEKEVSVTEKDVLVTEEQLKEMNENIAKLNKENAELSMQINSNECEMTEKRLEITSLKEKLKAAEKKAEETVFDLQESEMRLSKLQQTKAEPKITWTPSDYDQELTEKITLIGNTPTLQPSSKLNSIYKVIKKFYEGKLQQLKESFKDEVTKSEDFKESVKSFVVDISIALFDNALSLDLVLNGKGGNQIIEAIGELRNSNEQLEQDNENLNSMYEKIHSALYLNGKADAENVVQNVLAFKETFDKISQNLQKSKERRKQLKKGLSSVAKQLHETNENVSVIQNNANKRIEELENELRKTKKELEVTKSKLIVASNDLTLAREENENIKEMAENKEEEMKNKLENERLEISKNASDEIRELKENISSLEEELEEYESKLLTQKNLRVSVEEELKARNEEILELKEKINKVKDEADKRVSTTKESVSHFYEETISHLKDQCDVHRDDIQRLSRENAETNLLLTKEKQISAKAKKEYRKADSELQIVKDQLERERKLCDVTIRARTIAAETSYNAKLEDHYAAAEADTKRIFSIAASAFNQFFNASSQLDERSYRSLLDKVSEELTRLNESDSSIRAMLCAKESQTTEDAVAQAIINV